MPDMDIFQIVSDRHNVDTYRALNWRGTIQDYLKLVTEQPGVARTSFQRLYDMILSYGTEEYVDSKKKITRYRFFDDPVDNGKDAIYGLDVALMKLVDVFKSAAMRYGTEKRVILLHGPVGSCKSTIVRLLKKGLEAYSRTDAGALYTYGWVLDLDKPDEVEWCPMHEDPLRLIPDQIRNDVIAALNSELPRKDQILVEGDLCPYCRKIYQDLMARHGGRWEDVMQHIVVRRLLLSEKDRVGIGTFQPKDEKNQDSTELTGDINYRKIAEYGSDSDPRAFNFDGEFNVANRGIIEFIEVLKLDVAFLYDLLGRSPGAQDQAKEVRPDGHRRGHPRPHQRARIPRSCLSNEFMEGSARPYRQDRHSVHHQAGRRESEDLRRKDYNPRPRCRARTSRRTRSRWRRCGLS